MNEVRITRDGNTRTLAHGVQYAPFGPPESLQYGNGLSLSQIVDTAYRMTDISVPGVMVLTGAVYDATGNLTLRNEDTGTPSVSQFTYDTLDRLDTASGRFGDRDYDLNRNGNRTQLVADGETTVTTYPKNSSRKRKNKPSSDTFWTYKHDANGSITAKTSTGGAPDLGYGYDARNRLIRATQDDGSVSVLGEYAYNGLGQRVRKDAGGEVFEYRYGLDGELLAILDDSGQTIREFVYLNRQPLAVVDHGADALYYIHNDHLGTPRAMSDETGTRVWTAVYDPFGAATVDEDPDQDGISVALNLRFPGQYYDPETGLHYNYFRTYDPSTGRYLESDPIGLLGGMNTYAYVENNPVNAIDPTGELAWYLVPVLKGVFGGSVDFAGQVFTQMFVEGRSWECVDLDFVDIGLSAAASVFGPSVLSSGKTVYRSGRAREVLQDQLDRARAPSLRKKLTSRIANHRSAIREALVIQGYWQGGKFLLKEILDDPGKSGSEGENCGCQ